MPHEISDSCVMGNIWVNILNTTVPMFTDHMLTSIFLFSTHIQSVDKINAIQSFHRNASTENVYSES